MQHVKCTSTILKVMRIKVKDVMEIVDQNVGEQVGNVYIVCNTNPRTKSARECKDITLTTTSSTLHCISCISAVRGECTTDASDAL